MSVDSGTRSRLIWGFLAQWVSKFAYTIVQLVQVPYFLHFWSAGVYGEWLVLSAIPNYLIFSNLGFGSAALHEMTMLVAKDEIDTALSVFQSCWWLIVAALSASGVVVFLAVQFIPVTRILNIHSISETDARWVLFYLGLTILLAQLESLMQAAYRSVGRNAFGLFINSMIVLSAFVATLVPVGLGYGPRTAALVYACTSIAGTVVLGIMTRAQISWIRYGWKSASFAEIKRLSTPAFAFMGFPLGQALNLQGTIIVVSHTVGPLAVVVFATARTISRVALQIVQMINITFEPEFSKSYAQRNVGLIRTLHRRACQSALILSGLVVAAMIAGGPWLLNHWTQGKVPPSRPLLSILLLVVIIYSLWSTSSSILVATNQHKRLAVIYVAASAVTIVATWFASLSYGLYGAAVSLLLSEILMNIYVLPTTLRIAQDSFFPFIRSFFEIPPGFHPRTLLRRLPVFRNAKP